LSLCHVTEAARLAGVAEFTDSAHLNHNVVCQHLGIRRAMGLVVDEVEIPDLLPAVQGPAAAHGGSHRG
jgi:hypothetical protein